MSKDKSDKKRSKTKVKVDFTDVEVRTLVPEGEHHAKVVETSLEEGDKAQYIKWTLEVVSDDKKINGAKLFNNTSLSPQSLWNLRAWLEALGVDTPDSATELDLEEYVGLELMVHVEHETFEGKDRPRITDFSPLEGTAEATEDDDGDEDEKEDEEEETETEDEEEDDEDEKKDDDDEEDDDDEDKVSADEIREMDDSELADLVKKHKLKVDLKSIKKASKRIAAVLDALEKAELLAD